MIDAANGASQLTTASPTTGIAIIRLLADAPRIRWIPNPISRVSFVRVTVGLLCLTLSLAEQPNCRAVEPPVTAIAFSPDGTHVVAASQRGLRVCSWPELKTTQLISTMASNVHDLAFAPDGKRLAVAGGDPAVQGIVEVFSWPDARPIFALREHTDSVLAIAWRDRDVIASASLDHEILLWNVHDGKPVRRLRGHSRGVTALCFLADGKTLVSGSLDQNIRVWDADSGELMRSLNNHTQAIHALKLRPGSDALPMVASAAADRTVRFWQPTIGRMVRFARVEFEPHDIVWLPDGSYLCIADHAGDVQTIDPDSAATELQLQGIDGWAFALAVHPTDGTLAVGGRDGELERLVVSEEQ